MESWTNKVACLLAIAHRGSSKMLNFRILRLRRSLLLNSIIRQSRRKFGVSSSKFTAVVPQLYVKNPISTRQQWKIIQFQWPVYVVHHLLESLWEELRSSWRLFKKIIIFSIRISILTSSYPSLNQWLHNMIIRHSPKPHRKTSLPRK